MPIVDIKGVGPAQFPDGMSADDIRSFLQKKYTQGAINGQSDLLAPQPQTIEATTPSLVGKFGQSISDGLYDSGLISDRYGAQSRG